MSDLSSGGPSQGLFGAFNSQLTHYQTGRSSFAPLTSQTAPSGIVGYQDISERSGACSVVAENRWYVFGGYNGKDRVNDLYELNLVTLSNHKLDVHGPVIPARETTGCFVINNMLHIFGGYSGNAWLNDMYRLDLSASPLTWETLRSTVDEQTPSPRFGFACGVVDGKFVLFGGYDGKSWLSDTFEWDGLWKQVTDPFQAFTSSRLHPRSGSCSAVVDAGLLVFGGHDGDKRFNDLWMYKSGKWTEVQVLGASPSPRYLHAGSTCNGNSFVIHGGFSGKDRLGDTWKFELLETTPPRGFWHEILQGGISVVRSSLVSCVHDGHLCIVGGYNGSHVMSSVQRIKLPRYLNGEKKAPSTIPSGDASTFCKDMVKLLFDLVDVVLVLDDGEIAVNSSFLAARSEFFKRMLLGDMQEGQTVREGSNRALWCPVIEVHQPRTDSCALPRVNLPRISSSTLKVVLDYLGTDKLAETDPQNIFTVLEASKRFLLPRLEKLCQDTLALALNEQTAVSFLLAATACGADDLKEECLNFVSKREKAIKSKYPESLKSLTSQPDLLLELLMRRRE